MILRSRKMGVPGNWAGYDFNWPFDTFQFVMRTRGLWHLNRKCNNLRGTGHEISGWGLSSLLYLQFYHLDHYPSGDYNFIHWMTEWQVVIEIHVEVDTLSILEWYRALDIAQKYQSVWNLERYLGIWIVQLGPPCLHEIVGVLIQFVNIAMKDPIDLLEPVYHDWLTTHVKLVASLYVSTSHQPICCTFNIFRNDSFWKTHTRIHLEDAIPSQKNNPDSRIVITCHKRELHTH